MVGGFCNNSQISSIHWLVVCSRFRFIPSGMDGDGKWGKWIMMIAMSKEKQNLSGFIGKRK